MKIRNWNPDEGDCLQGDVCLFRVPDALVIDTSDEISPRGNRLILASGEVTGHHHAIWLRNPPVMLRDDGAGSSASISDTAAMLDEATRKKTGTARLYRDMGAMQRLVEMGELEHTRCAIGFLIVEGGPVTLRHDEHDADRIPPGRFYVGGQVEFDAAEVRKVQD